MSSKPIRTMIAILGVMVCAFGLSACHGSSGGKKTASGGATVVVKSYAFTPSTLTVNKGATVTWKFEDPVDHNVTVTSGPAKFTSPNLKSGKTFTHTFNTAGTYSYICGIHPFMKATVIVK